MGTRPIVAGAIAVILVSLVATGCSTTTTARSSQSTSLQSACRQLDQQKFEQAPTAGGYTHFYDTLNLVKALKSSENEVLRGVSNEMATASKSNNTTLFNAALEAGRAACHLAKS